MWKCQCENFNVKMSMWKCRYENVNVNGGNVNVNMLMKKRKCGNVIGKCDWENANVKMSMWQQRMF